ncbi:DnaJ family domain-containing protein [Paenibacillus tarimensis]
MDDLQLNVTLLRRRVPNLTAAARSAGLRPATVSNLCTGKIPIGRAEVRTLAILASLAGCTLDELIIRGNGMSIIETGIKVLDLLVPIVRGGTTGVVARPGTGQLVMLAELFHRLRKSGFATVFWLPEQESLGIGDVVEESEATGFSLDEVYSKLNQLREKRDIVLGADRATVVSGELLTLQEKLKAAGARPVTVLLVDARGEAVDAEVPYGPLDTLLKFDLELAARNLYPAVDPIASTSVITEGAGLESSHLTIQQRTKKLLRRYRELRPIVNMQGWNKLPLEEILLYNRGERLEAFLSQPFYVAEPYTQKKGEWVSLQATLEDVRSILDGNADHLDMRQLRFIGRLSAFDNEYVNEVNAMDFWRLGKEHKKSGENQNSISPASSEVREDAAETIVRERALNHWMDEIYSEFEQKGGLKDLPGFGKPLNVQSGDPLQSVLKNANVQPPWVELQQEIRSSIASLLKHMDSYSNDEIERQLDEINRKIKKYNMQVPSYHLQKMKVSRDNISRQYEKWT